MFLTKSNKLIWIVFLLPCVQALQRKIVFSNQYITHNVLENTPVTFICKDGGAIAITESSSTGYVVENTIVYNSILEDKFRDRFSYSIDSTHNEHIITMKNTSRTQNGYTYICITKYSRYSILLHVYYTPSKPPICTTNYHTKEVNEATTLQCEVEVAKPKVYVYISNAEYDSQLYNFNDTYLTQRTTVEDDIDITSIVCSILQTFPQGISLDYSHYIDYYTCSFTNESVKLDNTKPSALAIGGACMVKINIVTVILVILISSKLI